ncbi:MAG: hypothetical protein IPK26_19585 [Planctomycetes bacterium]|nr:hypothetical protein [Planctomycetota bacterium]
MLVLDHVYVFCQSGAPEQQGLLDAGLRVGRARNHPGQGTANVCFFFADLMLELIWLRDLAEARSPGVARLELEERAAWRHRRTSPFGIALRCTEASGQLPFASAPYAAPYLPPGVTMPIAVNPAGAREPMLFALPPGARWDPPDVAHPWRDAGLQNLELTLPELAADSPLGALRLPRLDIVRGEEHHMAITLTPARGHRIDLGPALPLTLHC